VLDGEKKLANSPSNPYLCTINLRTTMEQIMNLRATIEHKISLVEDFDFEQSVSGVDLEYCLRVILTGIRDGLLIGHEDWDGQTGDEVQLAPCNTDLDTLMYVNEQLESQDNDTE